MFDLNTKIVLIGSSCHKKLGPCKNSIGYIVTLNKSLTVLNNVVTMLAVIKFLRYGNKKKDRFETKTVLLTFPIVQNNQDSVNIQLNKFIHAIKYTEVWDKFRINLNLPKNTPIVVAAPVHTPEVNFKSCSDQEFFCWFESFLMSSQINSFINKAIAFQNVSNNITIHQLTKLQEMTINKNTRRNYIKEICKNSSERNMWIYLLRLITITSEVYDQKHVIDQLSLMSTDYSFIKNRKGDLIIDKVYSILVPYIFCQSFFMFKNAFLSVKKTTITGKKMETIINKIEFMKTAILELSTKNLD